MGRALAAAGAAFAHGVVVPLGQGLCLLPMTEELYDEVRRGGEPDRRFALFPPGFADVLATWSTVDPVAYVEAGYFGGTGSQVAAVWHGGELILGPIVEPEDGRSPSTRTTAPRSAATMPFTVGTGEVSWPGTVIGVRIAPVRPSTVNSRALVPPSSVAWVSTASSPAPQPGLK